MTETSATKQFVLNLENAREAGRYELSVDVYPFDNPRHPDRHYGHWNRTLVVEEGQKLSLPITWDLEQRAIQFDGSPAEKSWVSDYNAPGEYQVHFIVYQDGSRVASVSTRTMLTPEDKPQAVNLKLEQPSKLKSAVWFITMHCDFRCPYCWEVQRQRHGELKPEPFLEYTRWVEGWNRLNPAILDITGGEPFMQPHFVDMLEAFNPQIKVAITTNISYDMTDFVQRISPDKVFSMTISLHPTQKLSFSHFMGKCLMLKNRGFNLTVNYVTYPEQMWLIPQYKEAIEDAGMRFHVDPYAATPYYPYTFSEKEKEFLRPYIGDDRARFFEKVEEYPVLCSGGFEHLNVQPNGDAYRCIHDRTYELPKVGNILDPDFHLLSEWQRCDFFYRCPNCDRDKIRVERITGNAAAD